MVLLHEDVEAAAVPHHRHNHAVSGDGTAPHTVLTSAASGGGDPLGSDQSHASPDQPYMRTTPKARGATFVPPPPVKAPRPPAAAPQLAGTLTLLLVAVLWGSYSPTLKYLLVLPSPPSPALLTAAQSTLAALFLMVGAMGAVMESATPGTLAQLLRSALPMGAAGRRNPLFSSNSGGGAPPHHHTHHAAAASSAGNNSAGVAAAVAAAIPLHSHGGPLLVGPVKRANLLNVQFNSLGAAGLELGVYSFFAVALGTFGVQRISATKTAFLTQATSLITPMLVAVSGSKVAAMTWLACAGGVGGGALVALDGVGRGGEQAPPPSTPSYSLSGAHLSSASALPPAVSQSTMGVTYVLASCVFYALGTVRLGVHSSRFAPLELSAASSVAYAAMALLWLLGEVTSQPGSGREDYMEVWVLLADHAACAMILWAGLGPGALSSYLQALGQRTVPAAQAQVIYSSTPLWSSIIAHLLLAGEHMGVLAWVGGSIMLISSLVASLADLLPSPPSFRAAAAAGSSSAASATGTGGDAGAGPYRKTP